MLKLAVVVWIALWPGLRRGNHLGVRRWDDARMGRERNSYMGWAA